jgi:hypothetical protein
VADDVVRNEAELALLAHQYAEGLVRHEAYSVQRLERHEVTLGAIELDPGCVSEGGREGGREGDWLKHNIGERERETYARLESSVVEGGTILGWGPRDRMALRWREARLRKEHQGGLKPP